MPTTMSPRRFAVIAILLLAGILAGAQLGKLAPLVPWFQAEKGLSLVTVGWLTAVLGIFVAFVALPAGVWIGKTSGRTSIGIGSALLITGGGWFAVADGTLALFAARLLEGTGYCILCIALPAILTRISPLTWQAPVLAVWSGFVPLGFAGSDFLALTLLPAIAPEAFLALMTALYAMLAIIGLFLLPGLEPPLARGDQDEPSASPATAPILLLAVGFGAFVFFSVALFAFLPTFAASGEVLVASAGAIVLTVPIGNLIAGVLVTGRSGRGIAVIATIGFGVAIATALAAFAGVTPMVATLAAIVLCVASGVIASAIFAATPLAASDGVSVGAALGLVCQAGGIATLIGPPAGAFVIEQAGWPAFGAFLAAISLAGLLAMGVLLFGRLSGPADARPGP